MHACTTQHVCHMACRIAPAFSAGLLRNHARLPYGVPDCASVRRIASEPCVSYSCGGIRVTGGNFCSSIPNASLRQFLCPCCGDQAFRKSEGHLHAHHLFLFGQLFLFLLAASSCSLYWRGIGAVSISTRSGRTRAFCPPTTCSGCPANPGLRFVGPVANLLRRRPISQSWALLGGLCRLATGASKECRVTQASQCQWMYLRRHSVKGFRGGP